MNDIGIQCFSLAMLVDFSLKPEINMRLKYNMYLYKIPKLNSGFDVKSFPCQS